MRTLEKHEVEMVSGGAPKKWDKIDEKDRALPGADVTDPELDLPGNRTGWCRGYGNMKDGNPKHTGTVCMPPV